VVLPPSRLFWALKELSPTIFVGPPALFEAVEKRLSAAPALLRLLMAAATVVLRLLPPSLRAAAGRRIFGRVHRAFGSRARVLITGSAPCSPRTLRRFRDIQLPVYEAYGLTEGGIVSCNVPGAVRIGSVGRPLRAGSVRLDDDGQIIFRPRRAQSRGYWKSDRIDQAATFLGDGGIATGDIGRFDADGFLYIEGRSKEVIVTSGGRKIQPEPLERRLDEIPDVERTVLLGRPGLKAIGAVVSVAAGLDGPRRQALETRVSAAIAELNRGLHGSIQITPPIFTAPFSVENGLLTRNLKVKRDEVWRWYQHAIWRAAALGTSAWKVSQ
jgi:long-subunit acyl-CoA synthetase (AMP-forming)